MSRVAHVINASKRDSNLCQATTTMTINFDLQEEIQALQENDNDGYEIPHEHNPTEEDVGRLL